MEHLIEALEQAGALIASALHGVSPGLAADADALALLGAAEALGRKVDSLRLASASDIARRSDPALGHDSLAWRYGCRSGTDLITQATRISSREAHRRLQIGAMVSPRTGLTEILPPLFPAVAAALASGDLGVDAADVIVSVLQPAAVRIAPDALGTAERSRVASATGEITEENEGLPGAGFAFASDHIRGQARQWVVALDPDGAAPAEGTPGAARSQFGFGPFKNGLYPFRGGATPELKGVISTVMDAFLAAHAAPAFPSEEEQARIDAGELVPGAGVAGDDRTAGQKRADILMGIFCAAARDPKGPRMGGAAPTVLVHVDAVDLIDKTGVGWIDGVDEPVSISTVDRMVCAGGYQKIVLAPDGQVLHLGDKERFFTPAVRKAIAARDGGCAIPGCNCPSYGTEVHHLIPGARITTPTSTRACCCAGGITPPSTAPAGRSAWSMACRTSGHRSGWIRVASTDPTPATGSSKSDEPKPR
ncbi:HNH endonuclease signature motif containing protein [Parafrigoribacterium mesophilum]|uniref:HNH endonuclease signature motif containing protein n=1 Tax=Parafrigoribacterium mesophilum TaxID=433646 RepID=UPI0031FBDF8C